MRRLLLFVVILILYGSLYPWNFHARHLAASPLWILLHSWPVTLTRNTARDTLINLLLYFPVGLCGYLAFNSGRRSMSAVKAVAFATVLSASIEMLQLFDSSRTCSAADLVCNVAGAGVGVLCASLYGQALARRAAVMQLGSLAQPSGPVLLLLLWLGYQTFPWIPELSRTKVAWKFAQFWLTPWFSPVEILGGCADWLVIGRLLEASFSSWAEMILPGLLLLLPMRLLILDRAVNPAEGIGAIAAWVIWSRWLRDYSRRTLVVSWLVIGTLILRGLAPFHFQAVANTFSWIPFAASLSYDRFAALLVLLNKSFLYGAAVWLLTEAGLGCWTSALGTAALLAAIEVAQTHLPGRVAEITDPLLALTLAAVLSGLRRRSQVSEVVEQPSLNGFSGASKMRRP